jgi:hypothetical protein
LAPDVQEHFADEILRRTYFANEPENETVDPDMMAREENLHRKLVACRNASDQHFV